MRELLAGVNFELLRDRLILGALQRLRIDHIRDDGLVLAGQILLQAFDEVFAGYGCGGLVLACLSVGMNSSSWADHHRMWSVGSTLDGSTQDWSKSRAPISAGTC
jgi:hypothetical protein